jgi:hypothetical protein
MKNMIGMFVDLEFNALLLGFQLGNAKFCHFWCEWDSKGRIHHHIQKQWPT